MNSQHKYKIVDFIALPLKIIPVHAIILILYTIVNALAPAYETIVIAIFIDSTIEIFEGKKAVNSIYFPIILILVNILFVNLVPTVINILDNSAKNRYSVKIKKIFLKKRVVLEYKNIEDSSTRELIDRVCNDPVGNLYSGFKNILSAISLGITTISLLTIVTRYSLISSFFIIIVSIPFIFLSIKLGKKNYEMSKSAKKIQRRYNYLENILIDRLYAEERNYFGFSTYFQRQYNELYNKSFDVEAKIEKKTYTNMKAGSIITLVVIGIIVLLLLPLLGSNRMTIGVFMALVNAILGLVQTMSWRLSEIMREISRLNEYLKETNLFFNLSEKQGVGIEANYNCKDFIFETLEFRNVSFKYPNTDKYVLKNCSFKLENGKSYSIVGKNGAGKSTIIKLIIGLYDDYEGTILLNNISIKEYDYEFLRSIMAVLFQEFNVYEISLIDNIIMGRDMILDKNRFDNVTSQMQINKLASNLNNGYETYLGKIMDEGVDLSGGQKQKIAIARLLYSNSIINILDEPTAALDPMTEKSMYEMIHMYNRNRFMIYITHRLGGAKMADEILVVSDGMICEKGNYQELMNIKNGIYREMYNSQKSWYE